MMKHFIFKTVLAILVDIFCVCNPFAQTTPPKDGIKSAIITNEFEGQNSSAGYIITKDIKVALTKDVNACAGMTIHSGRVCMCNTSNKSLFDFMLIDAREDIILGNDYITYYEPNQDTVPPRYALRSVFNKSAKRVNIYDGAPSSWKTGEAVTLMPQRKRFYTKAVVTPLVINDPKAVFVETDLHDHIVKKWSLHHKTVYKIIRYESNESSCYYCYGGKQLTKHNLDATGEFLDDFAVELKVDEKGYCFARSMESSTFKPCSELGVVLGMYPDIGRVGWISPTQMVIDDLLYEVVK